MRKMSNPNRISAWPEVKGNALKQLKYFKGEIRISKRFPKNKLPQALKLVDRNYSGRDNGEGAIVFLTFNKGRETPSGYRMNDSFGILPIDRWSWYEKNARRLNTYD